MERELSDILEESFEETPKAALKKHFGVRLDKFKKMTDA